MTWSSNEWWQLTPPELGSGWKPRLSATVVVPGYGGQPRLEAVLAALAKQTYPSDLTSVVVSDDGTSPPLDPAIPAGMSADVIRQERDGFGLSRARAAGAAHGDGDVIAFIDSDMLPEVTWLEAHMGWHHVADDSAVIGFRRHVDQTEVPVADVERAHTIGALFDGQPFEEPEWIEDYWGRTEQGRIEADGMWTVASGGNISIARGIYERSGGFSKNYWRQWGGEDNEFAFRLWVQGALFVPERAALAWHLGRGTAHSEEATHLRTQSRTRLASRVPDDRLRRSGEIHFEVPRAAVELTIGDEADEAILATIESLLTGLGGNIGVTVLIEPDHPSWEMLTRMLRYESRVELGGSLDHVHPRWRDSPIRGNTPVVPWPAPALKGILAEIGEGKSGRITVMLEDGRQAIFWMTRLQSLAPGTPVGQLAADRGARIASIGEWG